MTVPPARAGTAPPALSRRPPPRVHPASRMHPALRVRPTARRRDAGPWS